MQRSVVKGACESVPTFRDAAMAGAGSTTSETLNHSRRGSLRASPFQKDAVASLAPLNQRRQSVASTDVERQKSFVDKLERLFENRAAFLRSSEASFCQYDTDANGWLDLQETQQLLTKLTSNLQLPPLAEATIVKLFERHSQKYPGYLCLPEFQKLYWETLHTVKQNLFPTKVMKVRRSSLVGNITLSSRRSINAFFTFERRLGSGSFGDVYLVKDVNSGLERVCKVIDVSASKMPLEQVEAEIDVLKKLDHPHIIKVFEVYKDEKSVYVIMEKCDGGELADRIISTCEAGYVLTEGYVMSIMNQVLHAVNYFHQIRVAHKDLKPQNILFQSAAVDSPVKIIDFGLAEIFENSDSTQNAAGTYLYMAPEILDYVVTLKCDVWSCGCILYQMLTGKLPFPGETLEEVEYSLRHAQPDWEIFNQLPVSKQAIELLRSMLEKDVDLRFTAQDCLNHTWFNGLDAAQRNRSLAPEICQNLRKYRKQSNLKNVLTNMLAHQLNVAGTQISRINEAFKTMDTDGNGQLSRAELADGLANAGFKSHEITQIISALDVDANDQVTYTEFLAACYSWRTSEINVLWAAFNRLDLDGDGKITTEEFIQCLNGEESGGQSKLVRDEAELNKLLREIDKDQNGVIDWNEFVAYMQS